MAQQPERVNPGDLITAEFMNRVLQRLDTLEAQVAGIPTGGAMQITFPTPSTQVHLGDVLHITGKGFGVASAAIVSINGVDQEVTGGGDAELVIEVKDVPVEGQSKLVTMLVSNPAKGSASTQFLLLPFEPTIPTGNLTVAMTKPPSDPKIVGRASPPYLYVFTVTTVSTMDEDFTLTTDPLPPGWSATPIDENQKPLAQISFPKADHPGTKKQVAVSVTIPPGTPDNTLATLTLNVTSKKNPKGFKNFGSTQIKVGAEPPKPQDKVVVTFKKVAAGGSIDPADNAITITKNVKAILNFNAAVKQTGAHKATATLDPSAGWNLEPVSGFTAASGSPQSPSDNTVKVSLTPGATAQKATLTLKVAFEEDPGNVFGQATVTVKPA